MPCAVHRASAAQKIVCWFESTALVRLSIEWIGPPGRNLKKAGTGKPWPAGCYDKLDINGGSTMPLFARRLSSSISIDCRQDYGQTDL
ncbi:MAG: hypothetical protein AMJ54_03850 [Deltaproteobacteria bacterium SG8_13]|nr:MAG: hypothetical protein AMJ54_03850 [Deltaproteobacteria bacterium SG8_13]